MCGKNDSGQLGIGNFSVQVTPYYVQRIPEKIQEIACGEAHTLALTQQGQIYAMGDNSSNQLGLG